MRIENANHKNVDSINPKCEERREIAEKMANRSFNLLILTALFLFEANISNGQIHRATNQNSYQIKYEQNLNLSNLFEQFKNIKFFNFNTNIENSNKPNNSPPIDQESLNKIDDVRCVSHCDYVNWIASIVGTFLVGVSGIIPAFVLPRLDHTQTHLRKLTFTLNIHTQFMYIFY